MFLFNSACFVCILDNLKDHYTLKEEEKERVGGDIKIKREEGRTKTRIGRRLKKPED
jgi:hypothetical protein